MYKFIHAADLHLDSPLRGLQRYEGAPVEQIRGATRRALSNLVDLAIREQVKFLLVAGDIFDGSWKDYNSGHFFNQQMFRLGAVGIKVFLIRGNHDSASEITRTLSLPANVRMLSTTQAETVIIEDFGVAIHGQGFADREVKKNLVAGYPAAMNGMLNIGMLHTSCTGRAGHDTYAPCTIEELTRKEYDYWALGHVHSREVFGTEPWIVFSGNLQGRHIQERGGKGVTLVTVEGRKIVSAEHCEVDVLRWEICGVDASGASDGEEVLSRLAHQVDGCISAAGGRPLALRVIVSGECGAHAELTANPERWVNEFRAAATHASGGNAWVEQVRLKTSSPVANSFADSDGPESDLISILAELDGSDEMLATVTGGLPELNSKLPADLREGVEPLNLEDPVYLRQLLAEVRQTLLPRMEASAPLEAGK